MIKEYNDFKIFNSVINHLPCTVGYNEIILPPLFNIPQILDMEEEKNLNENKLKWDTYLEAILNLPRIEDNESFKEFFCLHRLGYNFQYYRNAIEVLDFSN